MRNEASPWLPLAALAVATIVVAGCARAPAPVAEAAGDDRRIAGIDHDRDQHERQLAWQQLDPLQRQRVRDAADAFAGLPADEQARLREEFARLDRSEQRGWLLGPAIGAAWPQLSPLFSYVPEDERQPLLGILRDLDGNELEMLGRIAWRTPPEQRDALRRQLIAVPAANRAAWLWQMTDR